MAVGEAGELKGLKGSTSSPVLQDRGFSFSPYGTGYILSGADPPPVIDDSALARGLSLRVLDDVLTVGIPHVDPIGEMR